MTDLVRLASRGREAVSGGESAGSVDSCEIFCYDRPTVERVRRQLSGYDFQAMAQMFKMLSDETRLKIACALCDERELCVCDVANIIGSSLAAASHHLRLLRHMGIAKHRKEGKMVFYSLRDEQLRPFIQLAMRVFAEVNGDG